jgi:predicted GIY-YIG superfamily endonuclease
MVNYQNGKIYRIVCNVTGKQYIGSTISPLNTRLSQHKKAINCTSSQVLENGDYNIVLIEDYPCERKEQLLARERFYIENMNCVNKKYPLRTQHEWYEDNKERLIEKQKLWNKNNKEKCNEYQKTFDLALKIFIYGCVALYFLGFLRFLPDDLSDRIVNLLLGKVGLGK